MILDVLDRLQPYGTCIIAGGAALSTYLGTPIRDIDIWVIGGENELKKDASTLFADLNITQVGDEMPQLYTLPGIDIISVESWLTPEDIINSFDINLAQICILNPEQGLLRDNILMSDLCRQGLNNEEIHVMDMDTQVRRLAKYQRKFPAFEVKYAFS